ncbi:MAG: Rne/Rng family ribonuclease [Pseudomonadota bacterium]
MASNKMLIDASHPEETRVAVVRGNRIEEFDFESQAKKQLRGNIYLAKVTRVEPSLQAAFIDYGGNRHGFLAFSEIHPDYYQIPMADRQALLDEEAREAEEQEEPEPKPTRKRRSRKSSASDDKNGAESVSDEEKASAEEQDEAGEQSEVAEDAEVQATDDDPSSAKDADAKEEVAADADEADAAEDDTAVEEETASAETSPEPSENDENADDENRDDGGDDNGGDEDAPEKTIAAVYETDSISEPAPDAEDEDKENQDSDGEDAKNEVAASEEAPAAEEKPKRRTRRKPKAETEAKPRKRTRKKSDDADGAVAETAEQEAVSEPEVVSESAEEPTESKDEVSENKAEADTAGDAPESEAADGEKEKPKRKTSARGRKTTTRKRRGKKQEDETGDDTPGDVSAAEDSEDEDVESVGQEDALEEVPHRRKPRRQYKIQEVIKRRQVMLVQVVKEERGNKGAALTTYLSLAGRYSVLMPNTARGGGISRKITNVADRKRLKAIAAELDVQKGMGVILRTAGASRTKAEIKRDFEYLMRLWENVRELTLSSTAPCLVYEEGSLIKRSIRDLYDKNIEEVLVSGDDGYREAKEFMRMLMPSHAKNVKDYVEDLSIFSRFNVEQQLDRLVTPQVTLKSGGYLVINQTEALVSIDVNSGRSTREHSIEDTALQTNLEAADEIARQLRLRDLAGLIVIDFIDMEEKRNNRAVEKRIKEALKNDRARIQVGRISHFGLLEMSRQRIRASVMESTMDVCPHCEGAGYIRSSSSIALHVFRSIEDHLTRHSRHDVIVRCPILISVNILNNKRSELVELEQRFGVRISIEADEHLPGQSFTIERGEHASRSKPQQVASHKDVDGEPRYSQQIDDGDGDDQEEGSKRKRRRRRRGRRDDADNNNVAADGSESGEDELTAAEGSQSTDHDDGEGDNKPKKRRRRGKRGGRRNRGEGADADAADNMASQDVPDSAPIAVDALGAELPVESPDGADDETKLDEEPTNGATVSETVAADTVSETAESNGRGRNTRRPRKKADVSEQPAEPVGTVEAEAGAVEDAAEAAEPKRKKSGWWSRGGGFFN